MEKIEQSKGSAYKASLLKSLIQHKMPDSSTDGCIRDLLWKSLDIVDRVSEMDKEINDDLITVMFLYSLLSSFETFQCDIESRDVVRNPKAL